MMFDQVDKWTYCCNDCCELTANTIDEDCTKAFCVNVCARNKTISSGECSMTLYEGEPISYGCKSDEFCYADKEQVVNGKKQMSYTCKARFDNGKTCSFNEECKSGNCFERGHPPVCIQCLAESDPAKPNFGEDLSEACSDSQYCSNKDHYTCKDQIAAD